jgi:hypothetical protein
MGDAESSFTSPEDILARLETDSSPLSPARERTRLLRRAACTCAEREDWENARRFWADYLLFSLHARESDSKEKGGPYLHPMMEIGSRKAPDPDSIPDVMLDYFEERLARTRNPYLRARYADFLWQRRRQHHHARAATDAHLAIVQAEGERGNHREAAESARRALSLAFALTDRALVEVVVQTVTSISEGWVEADSEAYSVVRIVEKILDNPRFRQAPVLRRWANLLKQGLQRENDHYVRRDFLAQLVRVFRRIGKVDEADACRIQIAEEWESEATEREADSSLVAARSYQNALQVYTEAGLSDKVEEMKLRMRASYKHAEETEFKAISQRFEVDFTEWDKQIAGWLQLEPPDALRHLAACLDLIPSWEAAQKQAIELEKKAPLSQLIPRVAVDDGRPVASSATEEERRFQNVRRQYNLFVVVTQIWLSRAFALFREHGTLAAPSLVDAIGESPVFPDDKMKVVRRGFERYAEADYISAIHVLVPHLEDCLRRLLGSLGGATTTARAGRMREKPLDQVLEAEEIKKVFALISDRLWHYFEHVLVAEAGVNLRNDVAHGLLRAGESNEGRANIVVHLYLLLGLLRTKQSAER